MVFQREVDSSGKFEFLKSFIKFITTLVSVYKGNWGDNRLPDNVAIITQWFINFNPWFQHVVCNSVW